MESGLAFSRQETLHWTCVKGLEKYQGLEKNAGKDKARLVEEGRPDGAERLKNAVIDK